jgi:aspartate racemase
MGGMGPDATVDFMAKVIALTDSGCDQDHVHLIVDQDPGVPNRQEAICNGSSVVTHALGAMAKRLEDAGADFLIVEESVKEIDRVCPDAKSVGVMATDGCLRTGIYQDAVTTSGREALEPEGDELVELMRLITEIKAGNKGEEIAIGMQEVANTLIEKGADVIRCRRDYFRLYRDPDRVRRQKLCRPRHPFDLRARGTHTGICEGIKRLT